MFAIMDGWGICVQISLRIGESNYSKLIELLFNKTPEPMEWVQGVILNCFNIAPEFRVGTHNIFGTSCCDRSHSNARSQWRAASALSAGRMYISL